ncbi:MAG: quinolinate synthase NadA [Candidatus Aminicenantes bacterium]
MKNTGNKKIYQEIESLKKEHDAVVIAHNYQIGEVQEASDFVGDSLGLSIEASRREEQVIVFCGVHFMAETAAILAPEKTVIIPEPKAGCPMADMITADQMRRWKAEHPGAVAVCYVNSTADVKAECDICCTSSNAVAVVEAVEGETILFAPDKNLASWVSRHTFKKIIPWEGCCYVHDQIHLQDVLKKKQEHPDAEVWVHPECPPAVIDTADKVLSTGGMVREAGRTASPAVIIGTESGMIYRLEKENSAVKFFPARDQAICVNMKKNNLTKLHRALKNSGPVVKVPGDIAARARQAIQKMIAV